jgi:hypothetical protein
MSPHRHGVINVCSPLQIKHPEWIGQTQPSGPINLLLLRSSLVPDPLIYQPGGSNLRVFHSQMGILILKVRRVIVSWVASPSNSIQPFSLSMTFCLHKQSERRYSIGLVRRGLTSSLNFSNGNASTVFEFYLVLRRPRSPGQNFQSNRSMLSWDPTRFDFFPSRFSIFLYALHPSRPPPTLL